MCTTIVTFTSNRSSLTDTGDTTWVDLAYKVNGGADNHTYPFCYMSGGGTIYTTCTVPGVLSVAAGNSYQLGCHVSSSGGAWVGTAYYCAVTWNCH
jgi:hypothetical protein